MHSNPPSAPSIPELYSPVHPQAFRASCLYRQLSIVGRYAPPGAMLTQQNVAAERRRRRQLSWARASKNEYWQCGV
jgi:hypothetical protein